MPFLSIVRRPLVETRSFTQRFSDATQKRRSWRLGRKRRRVLFIACETLLPVVVRLPVTWQTRDMVHLGWVAEDSAWVPPLAREASAPPARGRPRSGTRFGRGAADAAAVPGGPESRFRVAPLPPLRAGGAQRAGHYRQNGVSRQPPVGRGHAPDAPRTTHPSRRPRGARAGRRGSPWRDTP